MSDFCECDDPGLCDCGKPLPFTGRADPSGLLLDRWAGCAMCDQAGRRQLRGWLRTLVSNTATHLIVFLVGFVIASRGWRFW